MSERTTESGIPTHALYRPGDLDGRGYDERLGDPGSFPFTRGARASHGQRGWIQRELSGEGDARRSNEQFRYLLSHGQTGLDIIGDTPTMGWLDADHPFARYAIGTQGVSLCHIGDWRALYEGIDLAGLTLSHSLPAPFAVAALYSIARERGISPAVLRGSVIQSPYYNEDCGYAVHMPFRLRVRMAADSVAFAAQEMPKFHALVEDTYYISEGGLDGVEEMALGFVELRGITRELLARGVDIDSFAPRIAILVNCRMDFFEEVAKVRATRRLYARMMRDEFGAKDPRSWAVNITAHTSGLSLTAQQPANNIIRGTSQALAMACAGVHALEVSTFDEAFRTPSSEAHLVGLRTQQVVQLESRATGVADPLGGSYYVEALTDEMERRIEEMLLRIEALGDPGHLADTGYFRRIFDETTERYARAIADGSLPKVGVNVHTIPEEQDTLLRDVAERKIEPMRERIEHLAQHRRERDAVAADGAIARLDAVARDERENLIPAMAAALEAGITLGEIAGVLRQAYGSPADPFGGAAAAGVGR